MSNTRALSAALVLAVVAASTSASAQGLGSLRKKAEDAKKRVETAVDKKPAADTVKAKPAPANTPGGASAASAPPASAQTTGASNDAAKPNAKVWDNYDFVPGSKIIFFTDFSEDKVGNFARGLKYRGGPAEIVERNDTKVLRATGNADYLIPDGKKLPERFTMEVDVLAP